MGYHSTHPPAGAIVCRYTGKPMVLFYYLTALMAVAVVLYAVYANEAVRDFLDRNSIARDERKVMLTGFSVMGAAIFADFLLQARAFLRDPPAVVITSMGVSGLHGGLWREIAWADLHEVEVTDKHIRLVRRPRNAITSFAFDLQAAGWTRFRMGEYAIHVVLKRIDGGKADILRAVRLYRPDLL